MNHNIWLCLLGIPLYIVYVWIVWSNKNDAGQDPRTRNKMFWDERQEIAITTVGALLFMIDPEGILDATCAIAGYFSEDAESVCISVIVDAEKLIYVIGGATFGTAGLAASKFIKKQANKKLR